MTPFQISLQRNGGWAVVGGLPSLLDSKGLSGSVTRGLVLSGTILAARIPQRLGRIGRQKTEVVRGRTSLMKWTRLAPPTGADLGVHEFRKGHPTIRPICGLTSKDWEAAGGREKKKKTLLHPGVSCFCNSI